MFSLFYCLLHLAFSPCLLGLLIIPLVYAVPHPILPSLSSLARVGRPSTSGSSPKAVNFAIPCPGCFNGSADAALQFELVHTSSTVQCGSVDLELNGHEISLAFENNVGQGAFTVKAAEQYVRLNVQGYCDYNQSQPLLASRQVLFFDIDLQDGTEISPSFTALIDPSAQARPLVVPHPTTDTECLSSNTQLDIFAGGHESSSNTSEHAPDTVDAYNGTSEDAPVKELRQRFNSERQLIRRLTMDCRKKLMDDLLDCNHDLTCSGKALCHHLQDLVVDLVATLKSSLQQSPLVSDERQWQAIIADDKNANYGATPEPISDTTPVSVPESSSSSTKDTKQSIVLLALEILAGVIGLAGLMACVRRHCRSIRRRVDRLSDREERRRAREYRRLARREAMRKRWVTVKGLFRLPCRKDGDEEKQALILEAAAPASDAVGRRRDLEQAWDAALAGDPDHLIVEIERAGREYLASAAERPNPVLTEKHADDRSMSSSLPSYESEKLPAYSSQPASDASLDHGYRLYAPSLAGSSMNTITTPESSIPDLSPRCSGETLRTLMSRD